MVIFVIIQYSYQHYFNSVIPVFFDQEQYSVSEGEAIELCVNIVLGNLPADGFVDFSLSIIPITAIGKECMHD